jgi:hypothetical protein
VAFDLDAPDHELAYWDALPLSSEAKQRIRQSIADVSDEFRLAADNRLGPDSPYFKIEYIILDSWGDSRLHRIDCYIRDDKAAFGLLFIAYMEFLQ